MSDYIIRGTAANNQIRAFAATTKELVEEARAFHETSPVATAALGRTLTAGAMMGSMMKGEKDLLTIIISGEGEIGKITVTANSQANVKGYVSNPNVNLPANELGKLDVARAVGPGVLKVIKDMNLKEPYTGQINLVSGEIAEDLTYYFATSEQIPSSVGLGVLMNKNNTVRQAGGFIIQLMPFAEDEVITQLEEKLSKISSVTTFLDRGMTPEDILEYILGDLQLEILEKVPTKFYCNCSKKRVEKVIISIGKKDIQELIDEEETIEVNCHFCSKYYLFSIDELKEILKVSRQ